MMPSAVLWTCLLLLPANAPGDYFQISVVDEQTGRGVPLVELWTVNQLRYVTDSQGLVALYEPELMGQTVFFTVKSHGYEHAADGFGFRGKALVVRAGAKAELKVRRLNVAERLYRVTGAGIYQDSVRLGLATPLEQPLLNARVIGSDSVMTARYRDKLYWFWGDTLRTAYPLGNFHVPGATSELPGQGGLDPSVGVNLHYFTDEDGFARATAQMAGDGPTWVNALFTAPDESGRERMYGAFLKVRNYLEIYARGLAEFDDETQSFKELLRWDNEAPVHPAGHTFRWQGGGQEYIYFCEPFPVVRVRAELAALRDVAQYEVFTCLAVGSRPDPKRLRGVKIDRGADGRVRYAWRRDTPPQDPQLEQRLVKAGQLKPHETLTLVHDIETGEPVTLARGSVYFNAFRRRWVAIAVEAGGSSQFGEVWFAEADTPLGPWGYARKVLTHDRYSFYNPKQHPEFAQQAGRVILFEGTYSHTFSGNLEQTPRYDYNQIMYSLDLADERVTLPAAVYYAAQRDGAGRRVLASVGSGSAGGVACFAWDRPRAEAVAVYDVGSEGQQELQAEKEPPRSGKPLFYALPADAAEPSTSTMAPATTLLYEYVSEKSGERLYSTQESEPGYRRGAPICRVWKDPRPAVAWAPRGAAEPKGE